MSAHPFGPTPDADIERLYLFSMAVSAYTDARTALMAYEVVRSDLDHDDPHLLALEMTKMRAGEVVKAQSMTLMGHGVLDRCVNALEALR